MSSSDRITKPSPPLNIEPVQDSAHNSVNMFYIRVHDFQLLVTREELLQLVDIAISVLYHE